MLDEPIAGSEGHVETRTASDAIASSGVVMRARDEVIRWRRDGRRLAALVLGDAAAIAVASFVPMVLADGGPWTIGDSLAVLAACAIALCVIAAFGLYEVEARSPWDEARRIVAAASLAVVVVVTVDIAGDVLAGPWVGLMWAFLIACLLVLRTALRAIDGARRAAGRGQPLPVLVVGTNEEAASLARTLGEGKSPLRPVGFVGEGDGHHNGGMAVDLHQVVGSTDELESAVRQTGARYLVLASSALGSDRVLPILRCARRLGVAVRLSTSLPAMLEHRLAAQPIGATMAVGFDTPRFGRTQAFLKRGLDLVGASLLLIILAVPLGVVWLAIRLTMHAPPVFRQTRVTKGGRTFTLIKFRTMVDEPPLPDGRPPADRSQAFFKLEDDDPRITRLGRLLRRTSVDELPQLWNVLRGDMSLVGPRPLPVEQVAANLTLLEGRHEVRAGITGWWQIHGRSTLSPAESVELDLFYIDNWSIGLDLFILFRTFGSVVSGHGAY
jgi:exopolysaccharide biosynthesis polyprenyl glycosylphosphotransferase